MPSKILFTDLALRALPFTDTQVTSGIGAFRPLVCASEGVQKHSSSFATAVAGLRLATSPGSRSRMRARKPGAPLMNVCLSAIPSAFLPRRR